LAITAPLVTAQVLPRDAVVSCYSLTGHSGGGRAMIDAYAAQDRPESFGSPRIYGLGFAHKHAPEMLAQSGLLEAPLFSPIVDDHYAGMAVAILLHKSQLSSGLTSRHLRDVLGAHYQGEPFVTVAPFGGEETLERPGFIESNAHVGTNRLEILVFGDGDRTLISARFDNLGKGASGAAVQNMNLMLGFSETEGLL